MWRRLVDADPVRIGIERIDGYPGRRFISSDPDLVAGQVEIDALVLKIKIQPDLVACGIIGQVERSDQAVGAE